MATKKANAMNKSAVMRSALNQYPNKAPAEIARILTKQHGVAFRRKAVSSIKAKMAQKAALARRSVAPAAARKTAAQRPQAGRAKSAATGSVAVMVTNLQTYIQRLGKDDLHRLIDTL